MGKMIEFTTVNNGTIAIDMDAIVSVEDTGDGCLIKYEAGTNKETAFVKDGYRDVIHKVSHGD